MILNCQKEPIQELKHLADSDRHSVLVEGPSGCGKSYLAKQYAAMLGISDFAVINPTVQDIRDSINGSYNLDSPIVLCIENLDCGVPAASYTILKFLEEPLSHVYLVVTCRNVNTGVPDTIVSRCACVSMSAPVDVDIENYAQVVDAARYEMMKSTPIWRAVRTFKDIDSVIRFNQSQIDYFNSLQSSLNFSDTISALAWKLGHYDDGSETDILFVINYLMCVSNSGHVRKHAIQCARELSQSRIAPHAVVAKFLFDCKYGT